jgi:hypothetical protein
MTLRAIKKIFSVLIIFGLFCGYCLGLNQGDRDGFYAYYTKIETKDTFTDFEITGNYADIVVHIADNLQFIFCCSSSYLPYLISDGGKEYVKELIPRSGDGTPARPDKYNKYSYVRIIENTSDRIIIHWRYMPDFENLNFDGVVHEVYTFTPDKKVSRKIIRGRKKLAYFGCAVQWI